VCEPAIQRWHKFTAISQNCIKGRPKLRQNKGPLFNFRYCADCRIFIWKAKSEYILQGQRELIGRSKNNLHSTVGLSTSTANLVTGQQLTVYLHISQVCTYPGHRVVPATKLHVVCLKSSENSTRKQTKQKIQSN
jgi:hypothetical protein